MSRAALLLLVCLPLLAACGEEPDDAPAVFKVKAPRGEKVEEFPEAGMTLTRPKNWRLRRRDAPGVFELASGEAIVAGWAYPRDEPLPDTDADMEAAKDRLVDAIHERNSDYRVRSAVITEIAGTRAIDVEGEQVLSRRALRTRSVHLFLGDVEYVIEAIAPPADFALVEERVMTPLLDSLEVSGEVTEDAG